MIGFVVLSLLAAVTADHLTPYLPYPRGVEEIRRVYPNEILRNYPYYDHRTVLAPNVIPRPLVGGPLPVHQVPSTVLPAPAPVLPAGVSSLPTSVLPPYNYPLLNRVAPTPFYHDIRSPYYRDSTFINRLPYIPSQAPIVPELGYPAGLGYPAAPAPVIPNIEGLPTTYPYYSNTPLVHTPFSPFIPPSTLVAPYPVLTEEDKNKLVVGEPIKREMIEEKKEVTGLEPVGDEKFSHEYKDEHGTLVKEEGHLVGDVLIKKGRYSYISPEGIPVEIKYVADENGYRVV